MVIYRVALILFTLLLVACGGASSLGGSGDTPGTHASTAAPSAIVGTGTEGSSTATAPTRPAMPSAAVSVLPWTSDNLPASSAAEPRRVIERVQIVDEGNGTMLLRAHFNSADALPRSPSNLGIKTAFQNQAVVALQETRLGFRPEDGPMRFHHPFLRALTLIDKEGAVVIIVEATDRVRSELSVDKAAQEMSVRILNCAVTNCPPSADDVPGSLSLIFTPAGGESIADLYRQAKNRVNFRLAAPTDISGLMVSSLELGPREGDPTVQLQMVDKRRGRLLRFEQGRFEIGDECDTASPSGANTPTPDSCSRTQTEVQGVAAVLERVEREDGVSTIQLAWRKDGIQYALNGINIPVEKVLQIARSIRPLDGSGD